VWLWVPSSLTSRVLSTTSAFYLALSNTADYALRYGFFTLLPLTAPTVLSAPSYDPPTSSLVPDADSCSLIVGDYNVRSPSNVWDLLSTRVFQVENMSPKSAHLPTIAEHIVNGLKAPAIVLLQEIQDDSGKRNDGTVSANKTLTALVGAISATSNGMVTYAFVDVPPVDGEDGGQPGGNIRVAYLSVLSFPRAMKRTHPHLLKFPSGTGVAGSWLPCRRTD
jgi:hypothetical protein